MRHLLGCSALLMTVLLGPLPLQASTIVAKDFVVDANTNTISIFSVVERIGASVSSIRLPELVLLTLWRRNEHELGSTLVQRVRLLNPDGDEILSEDVPFQGDNPRHRINARMQMLPFDTSGVHVFEISVRADDVEEWGEPVARYPIEVALAAVGEDTADD